jgi:hypothetical protein
MTSGKSQIDKEFGSRIGRSRRPNAQEPRGLTPNLKPRARIAKRAGEFNGGGGWQFPLWGIQNRVAGGVSTAVQPRRPDNTQS